MAKRHAESDAEYVPLLDDSLNINETFISHSFPGKGVAPSPTPWCSSYRKGPFRSPPTMVANFTYISSEGAGSGNQSYAKL